MGGESGVAPSPRVAWLLLAMVLLLSVFVQASCLTRTLVAAPLSADAADYFSYAYNLDRSGTYSRAPVWRLPESEVVPDKLRSPGYPFLLLAAGTPEPSRPWAFRVGALQALLAVGSVLLTWLLARRILGSVAAALPAVLAAANPAISTSAVYVLTETPFEFLLLAATLLSLRAMQAAGNGAWAVAAGLCWAACSLVRPTTQFLPPLLLALAWALPAWRRWRRPALWGCLAFALAMAPWVLRNTGVAQGPGQSLMVNSIVHGSYPGFMYEDDPRTRGYPYRADPRIAEKTRDLGSALRSVAGDAVRRPLRFATWYLVGKPYFFLSLEDVQSSDIEIYTLLRTPWYDDPRFVAMGMAARTLHWPLVLAALLAMALLAWRPGALRLAPGQRAGAMFLGVVIAYAIVLHMVAAPFPRYSIPFRPLLFVLGAATLVAVWRVRAGRLR